MNLHVNHITPILNVRSVPESIAWFEKIGFTKCWDWCDAPGKPATFGSVGNAEFEIFMCQDGQGGRGEHGSWMSIWVTNVDELFEAYTAAGIKIGMPPTSMPWGVREMHVMHPDGHIFRFSQSRAA